MKVTSFETRLNYFQPSEILKSLGNIILFTDVSNHKLKIVAIGREGKAYKGKGGGTLVDKLRNLCQNISLIPPLFILIIETNGVSIRGRSLLQTE